jgi:Na+:H+ antiporter
VVGGPFPNEGVAVVLFSLALALATGGPAAHSAWDIARMFLVEALGGGLLGLALGWVALEFLRRIDDYNVELMISLALVTGTYSLAAGLGVSGPVAVVVAGILIGNQGMRLAMSERTRQHLKTFWLLVDDTLNALLFLLIGLEIAAIDLAPRALLAMLAMIPVALAARGISVTASALPLSLHLPGRFGAFAVLTWGGLRGGLSVAMALALPATAYKNLIVTIAYGIVVFAIVVQGLTLEWVARRTVSEAAAEAP